MNAKERVLAALFLEDVDRIPLYLRFTSEVFSELFNKYYRKLGSKENVNDVILLYHVLNQDVLTLWPNIPPYEDGIIIKYLEDGIFIDEWGVKRVRHGGLIWNLEPAINSIEDLDEYTPPDPLNEKRFGNVIKFIRMAKNNFALIGVIPGPFEAAWHIRGFKNLLVDFRRNPILADKILNIVTNVFVEIEKFLIDNDVDAIMIGDDVGYQTSLIIPPEIWAEFIKPYLKRLVDESKKRGLPVIYHSDGNINLIFDELINMNIDGIHPIQESAGMNINYLSKKYADKICFVGMIDIQKHLPFATTLEVCKNIKRIITTIRSYGGNLIIGPTHDIQPDTPIENIKALVNTVLRYGKLTI
jgi:uroporphyrinogen decarboxylase